MNRILLSSALVTIAVAAQAAPRHATPVPATSQQPQWLGAGARIDAVDAGSPAARAGLRPGDRIVAIDGHPISSMYDVTPFVAGGGRPLTIDVARGGSILRMRAYPPNGRWQDGALGITGWVFHFGHGDPGFTPPPDPPYIPPPDPPPPLPPPHVIQ
jgi:membrane-associated protease RseP (regulator of RpoE activity)